MFQITWVFAGWMAQLAVHIRSAMKWLTGETAKLSARLSSRFMAKLMKGGVPNRTVFHRGR